MAEHQRACTSCGAANEEDARFCEDCGAPLGRACATCGVEAKATARFCRACGSALDGQAGAATRAPTAGPSRKTVTVMFADLAGSTTFEERVDAETARDVMSRYHGVLRATAEHHRAGVTKYIGDGFMAVWGVPEIGPDDAGRAVDAAVELQNRFVDFAAAIVDTHGVELALRVAVNTGEVVVGAGDADLVGDALNVAARLESDCPRGRVVVGEETWRSTRGQHAYESLGQVQVKGRTAPVAVYQWLNRRSETPDAAPFVGRVDEVRRLKSALDGAVATRAARLITVIGDPGVGKSRLAAEFTAAQGSTHVVEARCDVEGTVALAPIVEMLRARDLETDVPANVPERDRILRALKGLTTGVPGSVEETFWGLRRFVELQARDEPLVIVIDDIQWADSLLLDFIEHLAEWVREVPVLVLALARPELREVRADLVTVGRWVTETVHLGGLDARATAELASGVLGATTLPAELLSRLPSSTGGNPLFVRELVGMLVHDGVLVAESAGWRLTIDVDAIAIPPTIQALLASRLERLNATDRRVLEIASVVGTDFSLGAVGALAEHPAAQVKSCLDRLRRLELAQPSGAYVGDEPVWRFHHVLVRDVAYRRLLKSDRARLHERLADWAESGGSSVAFDSDEMIARHLETAYGYRSELGTLDAHAGELALRSARRYLSSARRALDRDELVSAGTQAARGVALAAADVALHADLLLVGCEAFLSAGDVTASAPLVDDLDRIAGDALAPWATCYRCQFIVYTDPARLLEVEVRLQSAIDEFGSRSDAAGLAKAHRVRAGTRARLGRIGDCEVDLFEALIAARQSGDHRQITAALGAAPSAALWGPSPVPKAGGRCLDVVRMQRMTTAAPSLEATSLRCLAVLELLRGRPDKARSMLAEARQVVADLGLRHGLMETELFAGIIESMVGDQVAAEPHFRTALEGLDALGAGADAGQAAALLARSVLAQGRVEEADRYATESERIAGHNLKTAIAWRAVRAEILAAQGQNHGAVAIAREAVTVAAGTDLVLDHAEACLALGRVLAVAGDSAGAKRARDGAEKLYIAKEAAGAIGPAVEPVAPVAAQSSATSRLAIANRASESVDLTCIALQANDVDRAVALHSDRFEYDDRRRLSGDPVEGLAEFRLASARFIEHYPNAEWRTIAARGDRLALSWSRWWDDAGNETTYYAVFEVDADGLITHHVRYDGDDFDSGYHELERRYYTGEGAPFASNGRVVTEFVEAMDRLDVEGARRVTHPEFRWLSLPAAMIWGSQTVDEQFRWMQERARQVSSMHNTLTAIRWIAPDCFICVGEVHARGFGGETYEWTRLYVGACRDELLTSIRQFELDDEDAAFAYANTLVGPSASRLAVRNRASQTIDKAVAAMQADDVDATVGLYADPFTFDDRRRLSGEPITDRKELRTACEQILTGYRRFEGHTLAVRGERTALSSALWSDDAGNETSLLHLTEVDDDGRIVYDARFDGDDFETAYRELDGRYYSGEGAAYAESGVRMTDVVIAHNRGDLDRLFGELTVPEFRIENRSRSAFPDRSAAQLHASTAELQAMFASVRMCYSAMCWLSRNWVVVRQDRDAVGRNGERYEWVQLYASEMRDGLAVSSCAFDVDDEAAAFAYAEERMRAASTRLPLTNRASEVAHDMAAALQARDTDAIVGVHADAFVYDDRRRLSGDAVTGLAGLRAATARIFQQYNDFEAHTLAVRGRHLALLRSRWTDEFGNETIYLQLYEVGDDGRVMYAARFDEDDFDGAYRELERRYATGDGAEFAEGISLGTEYTLALNRRDFDTLFDELTAPGMRVENRSRSAFPNRSAAELRASLEELDAMVSSARNWTSAMLWLSPSWMVSRQQRDAIGLDGERYEWARLLAVQYRDGRVASMSDFDAEDERAAIAYAEERARATSSQLAVTNQSCEILPSFIGALRAYDAESALAAFSEPFEYDDHRRLSGDPIVGRDAMRQAIGRIFDLYTKFEFRTLAVRGQHLNLLWNRWSDDDGNETTTFYVNETDDDGLIRYHGRFDEDDFESAYRELERRYYAGEGVAFADVGAASTEFVIAMNGSTVDELFDKLVVPGLRIENRSRNAFPDRSATQLRDSIKELHAMVASVRSWHRAICWLSPTWFVVRHEREAVGHDGERYEWVRVLVGEYRGGRLDSLCDFDVGDEAAAFAYAEDRMRADSSRLAVTNRSCEFLPPFFRAFRAFDAERSVAAFSERFVYDDHRRLSGDPIVGVDAMRRAIERIFEQYTTFDFRTLAVRGQRLNLLWNRWTDDDGNETTSFYVNETDDDGLVTYQGRFDEDDFESAYRELERRYYDGEGAAFSAAGAVAVKVLEAINAGNFDRMHDEFMAPDYVAQDRSRGVFGDRSAAELYLAEGDLNDTVASARTWYSTVRWISPTCIVARIEREAVGSDGEQYAWAGVVATEVRDGRFAWSCQFELNDEAAAFAYAAERLQASVDERRPER